MYVVIHEIVISILYSRCTDPEAMRGLRSTWGSLRRSLAQSRWLSCRPAAYLLAHLTAPSLEISAPEAFSILEENPGLTIEFERDLWRGGLEVMHADPEVSVINYWDGEPAGPAMMRCLHFNNTIDLVQSAIGLDKEGNPSVEAPIPLEYNKHVIGMSLSMLLHRVNCAGTRTPQRCAVLGAGGCVLPMLVSSLYPQCNVDAVELSQSVVSASRKCFIPAGQWQKLVLHSGCALEWLQLRPDARYDLLFLDICDTDSSSNLLAPPAAFLSEMAVRMYLRALAPGGVVAVNTLGTEEAVQATIAAVAGAVRELGGGCMVSSMTLVGAKEPKGIMNSTGLHRSDSESRPGKNLNSIIYIVNNPVSNLQDISSSDIMNMIRHDPSTLIRLPLYRLGESSDLAAWLASYRNNLDCVA